MTETEFDSKLAELDRLLNDPEVQMDPHRVWSLLAELRAHDARSCGTMVAAASAAVGPDLRSAAAAQA